MDTVDSLMDFLHTLGVEKDSTIDVSGREYIVQGGKYKAAGSDILLPLEDYRFSVASGLDDEVILMVDGVPLIRFLLVNFVTEYDLRAPQMVSADSILDSVLWEGHTTAVVALSRTNSNWFWVPIGSESAVVKSTKKFEHFASLFFTPEALRSVLNQHHWTAEDDAFTLFFTSFQAARKQEFLDAVVKTAYGIHGATTLALNTHLKEEQLNVLADSVGYSNAFYILDNVNAGSYVAEEALKFRREFKTKIGDARILYAANSTVEQKVEVLRSYEKVPNKKRSAILYTVYLANSPASLVEAGLISGVVPVKKLMEPDNITGAAAIAIAFKDTHYKTHAWETLERMIRNGHPLLGDYGNVLELILIEYGILEDSAKGMLPLEYLLMYAQKLSETTNISQDLVFRILGWVEPSHMEQIYSV